MKFNLLPRTLGFLISLSTISPVYAQSMDVIEDMELTDEEALEAGMTPVEQHLMNQMKVAVTPKITRADIDRAIQSHRLVIAVNKAAKGPEAQTLFMYENGQLVLSEKISTGREKLETKTKSGRVYVSTTPVGFFRPDRIYTKYMSYLWKADLPNAVFFIPGNGIALHATSKDHYKEFGTRASGGCVRLTLERSKMIREKVMDTGLGSQEGQYKLITESAGRLKVTNNSIPVDKLAKYTGDHLPEQINSWDTVIIVYEE